MRNSFSDQPYGKMLSAVNPNGANATIMESLDGFTPIGRQRSLARDARIVEGGRLWADAIEGRIDPFFLKQAMNPTSRTGFEVLCREYPRCFNEAMSTSDFTALTADILDRTLIGYYSAVPVPNEGLAKHVTLRDFRNRKLFITDGMAGAFDKIGEFEVYEQRALTEGTPITYYPDVYAGGAKISWRAIMNDDLGIFQVIPQRLAIGAQRTRHKFISGLYVDTHGPHASLFTAGFHNIITPANGAVGTNPPLTAAGLADALTVLKRQTDTGGDPILIPGNLFLVVGPALWATAKNLLNQLTTEVTILGGDAGAAGSYPKTKVQVNNWIVGGMTLVEDQYMRVIASAANGTVADTQWFLFADPSQQDRAALEIGDLQGYGTPQTFQKAPNTMRIGGGLDPMMGDFYTMSTEMKTLVAFGGAQVDGRSAVASTGAGV
jgi:hypothetical protein